MGMPLEMSRLGHLLLSKVIPMAVFTLLLIFWVQGSSPDFANLASGSLDYDRLMHLLYRGLGIVFYAMVAFIYLIRLPSVRTSVNPLAIVVAFVGSFILFLIPFLSPEASVPSPVILTAADLILVLGIALALTSLMYLRRSFSIIPEARQLIVRGPYRVIRHPMYT